MGSSRGWRAALAAVLLLSAAPASQARRHRMQDAETGAFDYYLLSLSIAPSFCALSPANQARSECRTLTESAYRQTPLTVHGLWPNRAGVGVRRQPQHCPGPPLTALPAALQAELQLYMPGGAGLARHEWDRHGRCSGLAPEAYFSTLVRLARSANGSIGAPLRDGGRLGHDLRIQDLLAGIASRDPSLARAVVVSCRFPSGGGHALIEEIRIALSKDFAPIPAEGVGLHQNSGCPQGTGFLPG